MSTTKYIRPMSLFETIGVMFRLYLKIIFPILLLNIILVYVTIGYGLLSGIFVGPVLMMTSNAILGKQVNAWQSIKRAASVSSIFKITLVCFGYLAVIFILAFPIIYLYYAVLFGAFGNIDFGSIFYIATIYLYNLLSPIWIFVPMIMLLERKGLRASFKRSFQVLGKNFSRILQMDIFINLVLTVTISLVYLILRTVYSYEANLFAGMIAAIFGILALVTTGFNALPYVFVYYEFRARYENYSEELLAQELGYQPMEEMINL